MSTRHAHKWQRLSDVALFCECGETKAVEQRFGPSVIHICPRELVYYAPVVVPYIPHPGPYWQWPNTTSPDITITGGATTTVDTSGWSVS